MKSLIIFSLLTVLAGGIFYSGYAFLLRNEPNFRFNRIYLLASVILSLVIPMLIFLPPATGFPLLQSSVDRMPVITLPAFTVSSGSSGVDYLLWMKLIYMTGFAALLGRLIIRIMAIRAIAGKGLAEHKTGDGIVWCDADIQPFSFFRTTYMPLQLKDSAEIMKILDHEKTHTRSLHTIDIVLTQLAQVICWFNPFIYLIERALRETHEFEADHAVIHNGTDPVIYTRILVERNREAAAIILGNNFDYLSIKRRLIMLYKRSTRYAGLKAATAVVLCLGFTLMLAVGCRQPAGKTAESLLAPPEKSQSVPAADSVGEIPPVPPVPDAPPPPPPVPSDKEKKMMAETLPQFPGGQEALFKFLAENIHYPEAAKEKGLGGVVMTNFIVKADGSVSDVKVIQGISKMFDDEAVRVIKMMPKWKPGMDKGKAVDSKMVLPIKFALR